MAEVVSTSLPRLERARKYREFARETLMLAESAEKQELKATYISLSQCWRSLAHEAESISRLDPEKLRQN
jgi:hypothetical protein